MFSNIGYYIIEGLKNLYKNKKQAIGSGVIMCCTMILLGSIITITANTKLFVTTLEKDQGIQVVIEKETSKEDITKMGEDILKIPNVTSAKLKTDVEAFEELSQLAKDMPDLIEGYKDDPSFLPYTYTVKTDDLTKISNIVKEIEKLNHVTQVNTPNEIIDLVTTISSGFNRIVSVVTIVLLIGSVLIISNTIKIAVSTRRSEISIMKYVGATDTFIKGPFVVEGICVGLICTLLSIIFVAIGYEIITTTITKVLANNLGESISYVPFMQMLPTISLYFTLLGIGVGVLGSILSMRKYLEV